MRRIGRNIAIGTGVAATILCAASVAQAACRTPIGLPSEWGSHERNEFVTCIQQRGEVARRDPYAAIVERRNFDAVNRAIFGWATDRLEIFVPEDLSRYVNSLLASETLTEPVKQGIRDRYGAYHDSYTAITGQPGYDGAAYRKLITDWGLLRSELMKMRDASSVEAEQRLIDEKILQGDALTDMLTFAAIERSAGVTSEELRRIVRDELQLSNEALEEKVEGYIKQIIALSAQPQVLTRAETGRRTAQEIGEYAELARGLVQLGALTGVLSPQEAATTVQVVSGVSQISTAVVLIQAGAASTVGGYGMALSGALTLASAFQQQGPSEGAQIMGMLRQISKQIADLQFTVEQRFDELSGQISRTELRLMAQFDRVLQGQDDILAQMSSFQSELGLLRREMLLERHQQRVQRMAAFTAKVAYEDERCLQAHGFWGGDERRRCIGAYDELVQEFTTDLNAQFTGQGLTAPDSLLGPEEQIHLLFTEFNRTRPVPLSGPPAHRPTLEAIRQRVLAFVALNHPTRNDNRVRSMLRRLDEMDASTRTFVTEFTSDTAYSAMETRYNTEVTSVLAEMQRLRRAYESGAQINLSDAARTRELAAYNEAQSFRGRAGNWADTPGNRIFELARPLNFDAPYLDPALGLNGAHGTIQQRLQNFSTVALIQEPFANVVFPQRRDGHWWVGPCDAQSGQPSLPISRRHLATIMSPELVGLTAADSAAVVACYQTRSHRSNDNIGIGNTNDGMPTIRQRIASTGIDPNGGPLGSNWCSAGRDMMARAYRGQPEYSWAFEQCHHGHFHQTLIGRTETMNGVEVRLTLFVDGYRSATKSTTASVSYRTTALDRCLRPFNRSGEPDNDSFLLPFQQEFPLVTRRSCASLEFYVADALAAAAGDLDSFMDANRTRREGEDGPEVTYRAAAQATLETAIRQNLQGLLTEVTKPLATADRLRMAHFMLSGSEAFSSTEQRRDPLGHFSPVELGDYVGLTLPDAETMTLRDISSLRPPSTTASMVLSPAR